MAATERCKPGVLTATGTTQNICIIMATSLACHFSAVLWKNGLMQIPGHLAAANKAFKGTLRIQGITARSIGMDRLRNDCVLKKTSRPISEYDIMAWIQVVMEQEHQPDGRQMLKSLDVSNSWQPSQMLCKKGMKRLEDLLTPTKIGKDTVQILMDLRRFMPDNALPISPTILNGNTFWAGYRPKHYVGLRKELNATTLQSQTLHVRHMSQSYMRKSLGEMSLAESFEDDWPEPPGESECDKIRLRCSIFHNISELALPRIMQVLGIEIK